MGEQRHIRFEDATLQAALLQELDRAGTRYTLDALGSVLFEDAEADDVTDAAHKVRDAQFPWYFLRWRTEAEAERYRDVLATAQVPFFVEHHESGFWFLVRRADQAEHDRLWLRVIEDVPQGPRA